MTKVLTELANLSCANARKQAEALVRLCFQLGECATEHLALARRNLVEQRQLDQTRGAFDVLVDFSARG